MTTGRSSRSSRTKEPSATDHQEIEWQFDASELEPVEGWLDQHNSGSSGLHIAPNSTIEITDTYYDTDDWRFYRAGYALRVRNTDGAVDATMKSLTPAEGSLRRRREVSEPLSDDNLATFKKADGPVAIYPGRLLEGARCAHCLRSRPAARVSRSCSRVLQTAARRTCASARSRSTPRRFPWARRRPA